MPKILDSQPRRDVTFETNRDHWRNQLRILNAQRDEIAMGGGERAAAKQKKRGKLLARERVKALRIWCVRGLGNIRRVGWRTGGRGGGRAGQGRRS